MLIASYTTTEACLAAVLLESLPSRMGIWAFIFFVGESVVRCDEQTDGQINDNTYCTCTPSRAV